MIASTPKKLNQEMSRGAAMKGGYHLLPIFEAHEHDEEGRNGNGVGMMKSKSARRVAVVGGSVRKDEDAGMGV
jgi:hypothetical protein